MRNLIEKYQKPAKKGLGTIVEGSLVVAEGIFDSLIPIVLLSSIGIVGYALIDGAYISLVYDRARKTALIKYADTNHDGTIDKKETKAFDHRFYQSKDAIFLEDKKEHPVYGSGEHISERIPLETLTQWLKEYKPKPDTKITISYKIK